MPRVADFIELHQQELLERFLAEARRLESSQGLSDSELLDNIAEYLGLLTSVSHTGAPAEAGLARRIRETFINHRLRLGYNLGEVTTEYLLLGMLVAQLWTAEPRSNHPTEEDVNLVFAELQAALDDVVEAFTGESVEDRQTEKRSFRRLEALARDAARTARSMPQILGELVELIQGAMYADGAGLLLLRDGELVLAATTGACKEPLTYRTRLDAPSFAAQVARSDETLQLANAGTSRLELSPGLRDCGAHAVLATRVGPSDALLGVLYVVLASSRPFEPQERRRLEALSDRLASLIERGQLLDEMREQRNFYGSILQAQSDLDEGLIVAQGQRVLQANQAFCRLSGYSEAELQTLPDALALVEPQQRPSLVQRREQNLRRGRRTDRLEVAIRRKDGHRVDIEVAVKDMGHGRVVLLCRDISEQKRAEAALRASEAEHRMLAEALPTLVWTCTADGKLEFLNGRMTEYLGMSLEEALRTPWQQMVHPDDVAHTEEAWQHAIHTGEPFEVEQRMRGRDGTYRWFLSRAVPLREEGGPITRWFGSDTDIDDQKRNREELARALGFQEEVMAILGHDLRNPLSAITVSAGALLRREKGATLVRRSAAAILRASERMARMVGDLLDFAHTRSRQGLPISPAPTDLREVARTVVDELHTAQPGRRIAFSSEGDTSGIWDAARLGQVVSNLLGNALRYGDEREAVQVRVLGSGPEVLLEVTNRGAPIPPEVLPTIFEPFRRGRGRAEAGSRREGLGLGLFIVKQVVAAHGGEVEVDSAAESGTTFRVRLPRRSEQPATVH